MMNTVLICFIFCTLYGFIIYQIIKHKISNRIDNKKFLKEVNEEIALLIAQINETSDRNVLLVENRLERLNTLLAQSDKKIIQLKELSSVPVTKVELTDDVIDSSVIVKEEVVVEVTEEESTVVEIEDHPDLSRKDRILLLHKQGISPSVIASQTKATIGEVELIISLSRS